MYKATKMERPDDLRNQRRIIYIYENLLQDSQFCSESSRYLKQDKNKRKFMNDKKVKDLKDNVVQQSDE